MAMIGSLRGVSCRPSWLLRQGFSRSAGVGSESKSFALIARQIILAGRWYKSSRFRMYLLNC
jgi:hypothetical protein